MTTPIHTRITAGSRRAGVDGDLLADYVRVEPTSVFLKERDDQGNVNEVEIEIAAGSAVIQEASHLVTNVELKTLDTIPIELAAAPGVGKYLQPQQVWIQKHGVDIPVITESYLLAVSEDETLTVAEAEAGTSYTASGTLSFPAFTGVDRWFFFGTPDDAPDLIPGTLRAAGGGHILTVNADRYERQLGTLLVNGVETKWWRITFRSYPAGDGSEATLNIGPDSTVATARSVETRCIVAIYYALDATLDNPLSLGGGEVAVVYGSSRSTGRLSGYIAQDDEQVSAAALSGQSLVENRALTFGLVLNGSRSNRPAYWTDETYDTYLTGVDDVAFGILVRYQVHDIEALPAGP